MNDKTHPTEQRTSEWEKLDDPAFKYHFLQWETPKRSTVHFERFVASSLASSERVIDLGCGAGAATAYLAASAPHCQFLGIDLSLELINTANSLARKRGVENVAFESDDWFNLQQRKNIDGVVSIQTLSWLPEFENPLLRIFERVAPRWVALSSLFYEGDISCRIEVNEHSRDRKTFYNVYSMPAIDRFCRQHGYGIARDEPFQIDVDIPQPENRDLMGTYTVCIVEPGVPESVRRLQISGPLLMNWRCILIERR